MRSAPIAAMLALLVAPALAFADRLSDRDVKDLVDRIHDDRDRFENALPGSLKHSVIRNASGETDVEKFLDDFQDKISELKDRIKPDYAASSEVRSILSQGSMIDAFIRSQPPGAKGSSEWARLADGLSALAGAYGARFPLEEGVTVRRISDGELMAVAEAIEKDGDQLRKTLDNELKKDPTLAQAAREASLREADALGKDAKALRDRVNDSKPSASEAERLLSQAGKVHAVVSTGSLPMSSAAWGGVASKLESVAQAYQMPWPPR